MNKLHDQKHHQGYIHYGQFMNSTRRVFWFLRSRGTLHRAKYCSESCMATQIGSDKSKWDE